MAFGINTFDQGDRVVVDAKDDFYAFVDGWRGTVVGFNGGAVEVHCARPDGMKVLFVTPENLVLSV